MQDNNLLYRPCVGIALFNRDGKVFVGERIDTPNAWQMPQGGIDENEDLEIAAFRELKEEIGTNNATILKVYEQTIKYDLPPEIIKRNQINWNSPYTGQEQTWIAMRFNGEDSEIALDQDELPEFYQWKWVDLDKTIDLIVPFKRKTYEILIDVFKEFSL